MSAVKQFSAARIGTIVLLALTSAVGAEVAVASGEHDHHGHDHSAHQAMLRQPGYARSTAAYAVPDVTLVDADGTPLPLRTVLDGDKPVMLNFIFTTCTTVCPVMSANFSWVQTALGPERDKLRMISISIDPDFDTPARLKEYAARHGAGPNWHMLTGNRDTVLKVASAFNAWRGDKMNHSLITFLRAGPNQPWVRLDGLATPDDLVREYRNLVKTPAVAQGG